MGGTLGYDVKSKMKCFSLPKTFIQIERILSLWM
jgi:hypothetical protein